MCGFAGLLFSSNQIKERFTPGINGFRQAASRISNRGDTDHQEYITNNIWLSHYRLAFQDVDAGRQPMQSQDGQHIIIFNGEVYNHLQLRDQISKKSGYQFATRSDTETILQGWKVFGVDFFNQFDGEFAFVIINLDGSELVAHRDQFGVKPLFFRLADINSRRFESYATNYKFTASWFEFASEIKGLASEKSWNRTGLLRQYVGLYEPICTPFNHIIQIPPGSIFTAKKGRNGFDAEIINNHKPIRLQSRGIQSATEEDFENAFRKSVSDRMLSDVELGVYLSGGIDSKAVAYELARVTKQAQDLKSFTVGFSQSGYDESHEALRFSRHLGFNPHLVTVDDEALNYSYPLAVQASELVQPYTNGSAKWWLSHFTRQYVQGVLTGDGADEVLCGYPSYRYASWWKQTMRTRGQSTSRISSAEDVLQLLDKIPLGTRHRDGLYVGRFSADTKNPWLAGSSAAGTGQDFIDSLRILGIPHPLFGQIHAITTAILGEEAEQWLTSQAESVRSWFAAGFDNFETELCNPEHALLLWQNYFAKTHLPVLILNWVGDRMEMANTLEGRTPFMSKHVRELIMHQPDRNLVSGLKDKVLLRRTYARLFPAEFANTPKKQFNAPFVNSQELMERFKTHDIFETSGLADNSVFENLMSVSQNPKDINPYLKTHLQSAYQTAICLSIVNNSVVENKSVERNVELENTYLEKGGPVSVSSGAK